MATIKRAIYLVLFAVAAPYFYDRYLAFSNIVANGPGKLEPVYAFSSHELKFTDKLKNCEDLILHEELGIAFLSCDPGRDRWNTVMGHFHTPRLSQPQGTIWVYNYASTPDTITPLSFINFPREDDFHPLGILFDPKTSRLYVINHSRHSGSVIEIFELSLTNHTATHVQTLSHPLLHTPNSMEILDSGNLLVTNDHYLRAAVSPALSKIETFSGIPGGTIVSISPSSPETAKILARVSFANGIAKLNETTIVVASSAKPGLYIYHLTPTGDFELAKFVRTPSGPDNLSVDAHGKVLIAGHPYVPTLMQVAEGRWKCDEDGTEEERRACGCWAGSWVGEWSEEEGMRTLLKAGGGEVCSSSSAVRDVGRGIGMVSMLYGRGLVVFRE
ncbi:hypothetical protein HBI06_058030 [Parastagonospora nodorum]|nr:hypothetical protein HBI06_058030 [Parastagonospora nodorum]KAH4249811.1 hypothetical protein HBI05_010250 [Parastagonospora nodorum]